MAGGKIGDVYYKVTLDADGVPQLAKVAGAKAGDSFGKGMKGKLGQVFAANKGGVLGMLGLGAGLGVGAVALSKVVDFMGEAVDAASNLNEAVSKSDAVFKSSSAEMQEWADGASEGFGQSKRQALEAAGTFGNLIQAFGEGAEKSAEMSKTLVELASDLASFNNTSVDDAIVALRSGLSGETEPLKRYGIAISDARMRTELMSQGVKKLGTTLTPLQKTQAAYALILKDSTLAQGDFDRTSDGLANTQKSLTAAMEDAQAAIGEQLLPVMVELSQLMRDEVVPGIVAISDAFEDSEDAITIFGEILGAIVSQGRSGMSTYAEHTKRELEEANKAHERSVSGIESGLKSMRTDLRKTEGAVEDLGEQSEDTADQVVVSAGDMRDSIRDLESAFVQSAMNIIGDYYDPIEARAELLATRQEIAAQRAIIASKTSTDAEIADARRRLKELARTNDELLIELAAAGRLTKKELNAAITAMQKRWHAATGAARADLAAMVRSLMLVKLAAQQASGALKLGGGIGTGGGGRASGGPVSAGVPYVVGERGPELIVPSVNATVIPNHQLTAMGGGGGPTYNIPVTVAGALPVQTIADIATGMRRIGDAGLLPSATASPQYRVRR